MRQAAYDQAKRTELFLPLVDKDGRLLQNYYPASAELTVEDFHDMYTLDK